MGDKLCVIVGASRGLGASLVNKCLENGLTVVGIGRTVEEAVGDIEVWKKTGRFRYVQADIGNPNSVNILRGIAEGCNGKPLCVVFNAAVIDSDVETEGTLNFDVFKSVNRTGIDGLCHVLEAFSRYLVLHGGMLVGISSFSAWVPPIGGNKVAYPASKAYLDMVLRSLRLLWDGRVHIMIVNLGHLGHDGGGSFFATGYSQVAERVTRAILCSNPPENIYMPRLYSVAYRTLRLVPDRVVANMVGLVKGLLERILPGKVLP